MGKSKQSSESAAFVKFHFVLRLVSCACMQINENKTLIRRRMSAKLRCNLSCARDRSTYIWSNEFMSICRNCRRTRDIHILGEEVRSSTCFC